MICWLFVLSELVASKDRLAQKCTISGQPIANRSGNQVANINPAEVRSKQVAMIIDSSFPLKTEFNCFLVCDNCFRDGILPKQDSGHQCRENVLVVQNKRTKQLFRIRERKNHTTFFGKYRLCMDFKASNRCPRRDHCTFAHNMPELTLWVKEKDGKFNITEFMKKVNSKTGVTSGHSLVIFLKDYPGQLVLICRLCYTVSHCLTYRSLKNSAVCDGSKPHAWDSSAILAHRSSARITLIGQRPMNDESAYYGLCSMLQFCRNKWTADCTNAHSIVEQQLWYVERHSNCTQQELVKQVWPNVLVLLTNHYE